MSIETDIQRQQAAIRKVERAAGPAMMKIVRETQERQERGEPVASSAVKLVELFQAQVADEMNRSVARDVWAGFKVAVPLFLAGAAAFVLAVYGAVRLLRWLGVL